MHNLVLSGTKHGILLPEGGTAYVLIFYVFIEGFIFYQQHET